MNRESKLILLAVLFLAAFLSSFGFSQNVETAESKTTTTSDKEIQKAVEQVLRADPALLSFAIETEVKDGVVTLRGTVGSEEAKRAAAADAMTVPEVKWVNNRIKVKAG